MTLKKEQILLAITLAIFLIGLVGGVLLPASTVQADLPVRDTPTPARPAQAGEDDEKDSSPAGAYIELQVQNGPPGAWSAVQWQNEAGHWYEVAGWQGTLDTNGYRRWWVAEKDFGTGPFRWVIRPGQDGPALVTSEPFTLPAFPNETERITVIMQP